MRTQVIRSTTLLLFVSASCLCARASDLTLVSEMPLSTAGLPANEPVPRLVPGDVNGDGKCEVIAFQQKGTDIRSVPYLTVFDGQTGAIQSEAQLFFTPSPPGNHAHRGFSAIAYMRSSTEPDIIVSGDDNCTVIHAYDKNCNLLWKKGFASFDTPKFWREGGGHYLWTYDLNGDGLHELCAGRYIFTGNGRLAATLDYGEHVDGLACADFDPTRPGMEIVVCGSRGTVAYNVNPVTLAPERIWTIDNKVLPNPQRFTFGELDKDSPGLELVIQGKGDLAATTYIVSGKDGHIVRTIKNTRFLVASVMDFDGDRSEDEIVGWQGTVVDKTGRVLSGTSWYSPAASWNAWNMAVVPMDVIGDARDEIVVVSRDKLCIGANTSPLSAPLRCFRDDRDYKLRFSNFAFNRGCLGFDYRKGSAPSP